MATQQETVKPDLSSLRISDTKRKSSGTAKRVLWVVIPTVLLGLVVAASLALRNRKPEVEVTSAAKPVSGPSGVLNASGYLTPRRRATIAAKITGRVTGVFFDEGTRVAEGQLLATLDDSDARRALDAAQADRKASEAAIADYQVQLKYAEIALRRTQELHDAQVQSQDALDVARTNVDSLKARI